MAYVTLTKTDIQNDRLRQLALSLGWTPREALGAVCLLYHNVQVHERAELRRHEVPLWASLGDPTPDAIVDALITHAYLTPVDVDVVRVVGAERQLTSLARSRGRREPKAVPSTTHTTPSLSGDLQPSLTSAQGDVCLPSSVEVDAGKLVREEEKEDVQRMSASASNTLESEKVSVNRKARRQNSAVIPTSRREASQPETHEVKRRDEETDQPALCALEIEDVEREQRRKMPTPYVWKAYKNAYVARYGQEPVRNAKVNAQIRQIVDQLGIDVAERVVAYYVTRDDAFYTNASHPIGLVLVQGQKLVTEMSTGKVTTMSSARRQEQHAETDRAIKSYIAKQEVDGGDAAAAFPQ